MPDDLDLAVVAQDPWFGGGVRSQLEPFWHGARALGREPRLLYLSRTRAVSLHRRSLARGARASVDPPFEGIAFPSLLPELDSLSQLVGGVQMAETVARGRSAWVVSTTASYGWPAARSGRAYGCWIGTGLDEEWAARRDALPPSRRAALAANAPVLRRLERAVLRGATVLYATSEASRWALARAGRLDPARVRILPIPVDVDRFSPEPDDAWLSRLETPALVFVGRADDPRKNLQLLLDAFRLVRARVPRARLRLVGRPPARDVPLPDGTEVLGEVESVAEHVRTASLFVLPSRQEGFSIATAEALAAGVPAVATPCGGPEELVLESGGGRLLSGFSTEELATTIVDLLQRPEALAEMLIRGRARVVEEHSPARFRERLAAAFAELDAHG